MKCLYYIAHFIMRIHTELTEFIGKRTRTIIQRSAAFCHLIPRANRTVYPLFIFALSIRKKGQYDVTNASVTSICLRRNTAVRQHYKSGISATVIDRCIWPRWLSWMRRPTGDQEVAGSTTAEVGNILSWRLIMKYFLRSFSPFR